MFDLAESPKKGKYINIFFGALMSYVLLQMDSKLPIDIFENVMQLAIEGCKAIANYIREVSTYFFVLVANDNAGLHTVFDLVRIY